MISYSEACQLIYDNINQLGTIKIKTEDSQYYILAKDIISTVDVAPFANSAMDGFAVCSKDIKTIPHTMPVLVTAFAGDYKIISYKKNHALKIMTGAPVPDGFDTIVKIEDTNHSDIEVTLKKEIIPGQNFRRAGEDIKTGDVLYKQGDVIETLDPGILASIGLDKVEVYKKPSVLIISTGNEIIPPGKKLKQGQIYNSNSYTIASMVKQFCQTIEIVQSNDNPEEIKKHLKPDYDIIVTSGGVSMGDKDYIPSTVESCGFEPIFHKASIKPGKPIYFAKKEKQLLFGLPGNPLSTAITCAVFLIPALKNIIGSDNYQILTYPAK